MNIGVEDIPTQEKPKPVRRHKHVGPRGPDGQRLCEVPGCGRKNFGLGYCVEHWKRFKKTGDPMIHIPLGHNHVGARNPRWRGGEIGDSHGRVTIYSPGHPHPTNYGTHVYRYRLVMEKHLGRYLLPSEIVHHKNGNHNDDRIENLEVMSQAEHARLHVLQRVKCGWSIKHERCVDCGTTKNKHEAHGQCRPCYARRKNHVCI